MKPIAVFRLSRIILIITSWDLTCVKEAGRAAPKLSGWRYGDSEATPGKPGVRDAAPDLIIGSWCGKKFRPEQVAARPGWSQIPAVAAARDSDQFRYPADAADQRPVPFFELETIRWG